MKRIGCGDCGAPLGNMEIALNLKLRGRAARTFFCLQCLGQQLDCPREELKRMAVFFLLSQVRIRICSITAPFSCSPSRPGPALSLPRSPAFP